MHTYNVDVNILTCPVGIRHLTSVDTSWSKSIAPPVETDNTRTPVSVQIIPYTVDVNFSVVWGIELSNWWVLAAILFVRHTQQRIITLSNVTYQNNCVVEVCLSMECER